MNHLGERLIIKVPASTANLGSGFDSIGIAFQLYLTIKAEPAEQTHFVWKGKELESINITDEDNLILRAMDQVFQQCSAEKPALRIEVESEIPLTRGLGSSASAFVGGLVLANECLNKPLRDDELLWLATKEEGHPDNAGASLLGGVFLASVDWKGEKVYYHKQKFPQDYKWLAAIPSYPLSTSLARELLPEKYSKADVVFNLSRFGVLVASLITGNREGMRIGLEDALHQPYRQQLIPGFSTLLEKKDKLGVLGFVISGAGPTVLGLIDRELEENEPLTVMEQCLATTTNHTIEVKPLEVDQTGYQVQREPI